MKKDTASQDFAVRLQRDRLHSAIRVGIERSVECAVGIQPRDVIARHAANHREFTTDQNLPVGLKDYGKNPAAPNGLLTFGSKVSPSAVTTADINASPMININIVSPLRICLAMFPPLPR